MRSPKDMGIIQIDITKDFADQLHWCELCSACLDVPKRISSDGRDDIVPSMLERLRGIGSPKAAHNMYVLHDPTDYNPAQYKTFTGSNDYMEAGGNKRTSKENRNLYPKSFALARWDGLAESIRSGEAQDWILVSDDFKEAEEAREYFRDVIINPGCLYVYGDTIAIHVRARSLQQVIRTPERIQRNIWGYYPPDKIVVLEKEQVRMQRCLLARMQGADHPRVVVYGAGPCGKRWFSFLSGWMDVRVCGWVDRKAEEIGYPVQPLEALGRTAFDFVLVAVQAKRIYEEIRGYLLGLGLRPDAVLWSEDFCGERAEGA